MTDIFNKACYQNDNKNKRIEAFGKIHFLYEKKLVMIAELMNSNLEKLKELANRRKKLIEEHDKQIEKFKKGMLKLAMLKINEKNKMLEGLEKAHSKQLDNMDKRKVELEDQQSQLQPEFNEINLNFTQFLKNPDDEISEYISEPKND